MLKPPSPAEPAGAALPGTLNKAVQALAIEPLSMALTVTGRKAYDVMIWLAQRGTPAADGGYSSPVATILKGYGSSTKASERVQRYIEQMVQTSVVWRPLAASDAGTLTLEGFEPPAAPAAREEARTFPLLAEARLYKRAGEWWVTWYYPPSIREQLVSPERWAQIELNSIARLTTYTAVALYEICARYKDSPAGLTSRHPPDFWTAVLREGGGLKPREFRKFKSELLQPAVREINAKTEIEVELLEHRAGALLEAVQFRVARKPETAAAAAPLEPADVTLPLAAAQHGIREEELDALVLKHGAARVADALDAMRAQLDAHKGPPIRKPAAYLAAILANRNPPGTPPTPPNAQELQVAARLDPQRDREQRVQAWKARRLREMREEFAAQPPEVKAEVLARARQHRHFNVMSAAMRRRLDAGEWESPLVSQIVLDTYAAARYGAQWKEPGEMDLLLAGVEDARAL